MFRRRLNVLTLKWRCFNVERKSSCTGLDIQFFLFEFFCFTSLTVVNSFKMESWMVDEWIWKLRKWYILSVELRCIKLKFLRSYTHYKFLFTAKKKNFACLVVVVSLKTEGEWNEWKLFVWSLSSLNKNTPHSVDVIR